MGTGGADAGPQQVLRSMVDKLEAGDHRGVLDPSRNGVVAALGATVRYARLTPLFVAVAIGQAELARGDVYGARHSLGAAVRHLPIAYHARPRSDGIPKSAARVLPVFVGGDPDENDAVRRVAGVIWREQGEVDHLSRCTLGLGPREILAVAVGEDASWGWLDPGYHRALLGGHGSHGTPSTRRPQDLCERAMQLGGPATVQVTPRIWKSAGGYDRLLAEALARLAERKTPAPWQDPPDGTRPPVRLGLQQLWTLAGLL